MDINGTLIVQGFNFFIAYCLLKKFLFKPVLEVMDTEAQQQKALSLAIESRKALVIVKEQEKQSRWREHQRFFKSLIPYHQELGIIKMGSPERTVMAFEDDLEPLKHDVAKTLIEKVEHVRW